MDGPKPDERPASGGTPVPSAVGPAAVSPDHDLRGVLRVSAFRQLWTALSLSSLGDWLGLLALTAMAPRLAQEGYAAANLAIAGVFILRLAPAVIVGPIAGVVADRLDRRWTMVVCDLARFGLFLSIPLVGTLWWLFVATFLIEVASLLWIPAKEATVPNLVPRERLEAANQLSLFTTYGSAPVAAAIFAGLALLSGILDNPVPAINQVDLALYVNAATFLVSAVTILRLRGIPRVARPTGAARPSVWSTLVEGWRYVGATPLVRGLVVGMLGAFAAGGAVIGLARTFVADLGAGDPGYGLLFGTVFLGLAGGMFVGPRLLPDFSRRRLFALAIGSAGLALALLALVPNMVLATLITLVVGALAGVAWVTGYTLLGLEVADEVRGRTFAFVQTTVRLVLVLVLAVAPLLAAAFGRHDIRVTDEMTLTYSGAAITFLLAGLLAAGLGVLAFRQLDDRRGVPLRTDLAAAFRSEPVGLPGGGSRRGFFVALEGGEGAGKSTQARLLGQWLESRGYDVVLTHEPGGTEVGRRLRSVLLDRPEGDAADRAEHVAQVVAPALALGHVVITDRYVDSSVAYQGAARGLGAREISRLSRWATAGLVPDLTVVLDLPAEEGLQRVTTPDRLESEPLGFHQTVRERYREIARRGGARYLLVDATEPPEEVAATIRARLEPMLPPSPTEVRAQEEAARAAEERRQLEEGRRRLEEARARADAQEKAKRAAEEAAQRRAREQAEAAQRRAREEAEAAQRRAREQAEREERRRQAEAAAAERAARREERRRRKQEQRLARREAHRRLAEPPSQPEGRYVERGGAAYTSEDAGEVPEPQPAAADPPTRRLSLADELFGLDEDEDPDRTIQLPRVGDRDER